MSQEDKFKDVISHCKEYGFVFQSSEIYEGLSAVYDYGPNGVELKKNIRDYWWKSMVQMHENIVGIDAAIFMAPKVWKASGHVDGFSDPMIDNLDSNKRYRADVLLEEHIEKISGKIEKEVAKGLKRFGDDFDEEQFRETNPNVKRNKDKIENIENTLKQALDNGELHLLKELIEELGIACPISGSKNWTEVRQFNLMYSTQMSATDGDDEIYLRPETAQGIFVNYLNVQKTSRKKLPFGVAQTGKAFRNEIVARQFIMRMKEFEQMEMQFFVKPGTEMEWYKYWKDQRMKWHLALGTENSNYRYHDHIKLAHYANAAVDIEYKFPFGFKEVEGIHSRTDFDLSQHEEFSGKKLQYFDPEEGKNYVPYVVETSIGLDRMFLLLMCNSLEKENLENGETRTVLRLPAPLAPVKVAVLPLVKKDGLPEFARSVIDKLKFSHNCYYEEKDAIGKRYRRQDAIGTPFCLTVDYESLENNDVTVRWRDSMEQKRIKVEDLEALLNDELSMTKLLMKLQES
jgi:glycyl-tRNA synthetase